MFYDYIETPFGDLMTAWNENGLTYVNYSGGKHSKIPESTWKRETNGFLDIREQLAAYFEGELKEFNLPLAPEGTEFQMNVWKELRKIPYGETRSYGDIASVLGNPGASRAVGSANGRNPIVIIQPCHRVIGSSGKLTGFAYGVDMKRSLLELEKRGLGV